MLHVHRSSLPGLRKRINGPFLLCSVLQQPALNRRPLNSSFKPIFSVALDTNTGYNNEIEKAVWYQKHVYLQNGTGCP